MEFNFKKLKKEFMRITLPDDRHITIKPPKFSDFKKFAKLGDGIKTDEDAFKGVVEILNMNMEGVKFTVPECQEMFDIADVYALMTEFMHYLTRITSQKN